jgi:hypothetical protein
MTVQNIHAMTLSRIRQQCLQVERRYQAFNWFVVSTFDMNILL